MSIEIDDGAGLYIDICFSSISFIYISMYVC